MSTVKNLLLACFAVCGFAVVAADEMPIRDMNVMVELTASPDAEYRDHKEFSIKNRPDNRWLMIKVKYTPDAVSDYAPKFKIRKGVVSQIEYPGWLDNVELKLQVLFDTKVVLKNKTIHVLFSGKSVFRSIKRDGKDHLAVMFVPARMIDRYCSNWSTAKLGKNSFRVKAEMFYGGKLLATGYFNVPGKSNDAKEEAFEGLMRSIPAQLQFENTVLARSRSPWALLAPDNHDLEVSESVGVAQE